MRLHIAAALAAGAALLPAAAPARTLKIPEGDPAVMLEVPDDWTVTPADGGLQIVSPDHTSIVLAGMAKADRAGLATWQRSAGRRMVDFGITFDAKATPPRDARAAVESDPITPVMGPTAEATAKAGELAPLSSVPSMALLGRASDLSVADLEAGGAGPAGPAIAGIGAAKPAAAGKAGEAKASEGKPSEGKTGQGKTLQGKAGDSKAGPDGVAADKAATADKAGKPLHFASVVIHGASLGGKPVDVQFLNFGYSKERWFLMQQESSPDDDRAGAIVKSVRAVR